MARGIKTGGRQKGSMNKPKRALLALLREKYPNYHPVIEMAKIAHETDDLSLAAQMHKEIAQYVEPKRKAIEVEHSGEVTQRVVSAQPVSEDEWTERYGNSLESSAGATKSTH